MSLYSEQSRDLPTGSNSTIDYSKLLTSGLKDISRQDSLSSIYIGGEGSTNSYHEEVSELEWEENCWSESISAYHVGSSDEVEIHWDDSDVNSR